MNERIPAKVGPRIWAIRSAITSDTLVIDTIGIMTGPLRRRPLGARRIAMRCTSSSVYRFIDGAAAKMGAGKVGKRTDACVVPMGVARLRPRHAVKGLQLELTVEDPNIFTTWTALVTYRRVAGPWENGSAR